MRHGRSSREAAVRAADDSEAAARPGGGICSRPAGRGSTGRCRRRRDEYVHGHDGGNGHDRLDDGYDRLDDAQAADTTTTDTTATATTSADTTTAADTTTTDTTASTTTTDTTTTTATAPAAAPALSVDKANYIAGDTVVLTGTGFTAGESVSVHASDTGASAWTSDGSATVASDGTFTASFQLPSLFASTFTATATGAPGESASVNVTDALNAAAFTPSIQTDKADYAPGSVVTISGSGWPANDTLTVFTNDTIGNTWSNTGQPDDGCERRVHLHGHAAELVRLQLHGRGERCERAVGDGELHR